MSHDLDASAFTAAPLRNRMRVDLDAPVNEVWAVIGDPARMPEFSAGLERVEGQYGADGRCEAFTCHFKPTGEEQQGAVVRDRVRWWEVNRGWASSSVEADAFGMKNDLNVTLVEPTATGTTVTWAAYFDAEDVPYMKSHYAEALADIGQNLARRFGGRVVEQFVER